MIFQRSLLREFANTGLAVFVDPAGDHGHHAADSHARLGRAGHDSHRRRADPFLGLAALRYLPILLSLTLFISVLTTLTRSYRDSEMVVWFSTGRSLVSCWIRPVLWYSLRRSSSLIALLSLAAVALGRAQGRGVPPPARQAAMTSRPSRRGCSRNRSNADRVYFVEKLDRQPVRWSRTSSSTRSRTARPA